MSKSRQERSYADSFIIWRFSTVRQKQSVEQFSHITNEKKKKKPCQTIPFFGHRVPVMLQHSTSEKTQTVLTNDWRPLVLEHPRRESNLPEYSWLAQCCYTPEPELNKIISIHGNPRVLMGYLYHEIPAILKPTCSKTYPVIGPPIW